MKTTEIHGTGLQWRQISHLHLPLRQMGSELLGRTDDLPLVPQQVHPEALDVTEGESRPTVEFSSTLQLVVCAILFSEGQQ